MNARLDHLVLNTHYDIDAALAQLSALGFHVTPRGYHTLGSVNHLLVFAGGYLELIGQPRDSAVVRQEILDSPRGLDGLVVAVDDVQVCHDHWLALGLQAQPVQHFSRPVTIDGQALDARFATVRLVPGQFAAGRVYACHHLTPELVWRPEWMTHANGVHGISRLLVCAPDPAQAAAQYALLGQWGEDFSLEFETPDSLAARYDALAVHMPQRANSFAAIRLRGGDLAQLAERATTLGLPHAWMETRLESGRPARLLIALPAFSALLEFE